MKDIANQSPEERASALLSEMELDEKITLLYGVGGVYVGNTQAIDRLKIPALTLNDGPQGWRVDQYPRTSTSFPSCKVHCFFHFG